MLTLEQIIDLQSKGFSYDQISIINSLDVSTTANSPKQEPEKQEPEKEPEKQEPEKEPEKQEPEKQEPENDRVKALEDKIGKLTDTIKAMQSANVKGAQSTPPKIETVDDIIKSFMVAS